MTAPEAEASLPSVCHVCGGGPLERINGLAVLATVSSDCLPSDWRSELRVCPACATTQKNVDDAWRKAAAAIYDAYSIYHQSGGAEQPVFRAGSASPRSEALLRWAISLGALPDEGTLADVGCGNGGFLLAFSGLRPAWRLRGLEWGERHRQAVLSIPGVEGFDPDGLDGLTGILDAAAMLHVLEHIPNPIQTLARVRAHLRPEGRLILLLPDHASNPFDLVVADHCTHFSPTTLERTLRLAGFDILAMSANEAIPKEIAVLATPAPNSSVSAFQQLPPATPGESATRAAKALAFLTAVLAAARQAVGKVKYGGLGVFGSSIGGVWLASQLGESTTFFVDEDPARIGRELMGRPVVHPSDVPPGSKVVIPLAPEVGRSVAERLGAARPDVDWILPYPDGRP